jgi:hypothetical protein
MESIRPLTTPQGRMGSQGKETVGVVPLDLRLQNFKYFWLGIRITGVSARTAFERESLLKERRDVRGDGSHFLPPTMYASHRSAMLRMSSGTASRYQ